MSRVIYQGFKGRMLRVDHPSGNPRNPNFVIQWNGRDWSGFRTLEACAAQFAEIETRPEREVEKFSVVERL